MRRFRSLLRVVGVVVSRFFVVGRVWVFGSRVGLVVRVCFFEVGGRWLGGRFVLRFLGFEATGRCYCEDKFERVWYVYKKGVRDSERNFVGVSEWYLI